MSSFELATVLFAGVILFHAWREVPATCRKPTKARIWGLFVVAILGGAGLGFGIASSFFVPILGKAALQGIARIENQELLAASISTSGLLRLEEGKTDETKALLATTIARFYDLLMSAKPPPKNREELVAAIESTAKKSPILRQKIQDEIGPAATTASPSP